MSSSSASSPPAPLTVVMLVDHAFVNGGAARVAIDEAVALAEAGHRVIALAAVGPVGPELARSNVEVVCLNQPELIHVGKNPLVAFQGLWNIRAARAMRRILAPLDRSTTVVHLQTYTKALTTSPVRVAVKAGFPVVATLHDYFAVCPNGGLFDYVDNAPCRRRCLSVSCVTRNCDKRHYAHKLYRVARSWIQKYVGGFPARLRHFIVLSAMSEKHLRPYLPPAARTHALENPIEIPLEAPVDVGANDHLVAGGRLDPEKGVELVLDAVREAGVSLTFVGDGPLRAKAEATPGVRVTGWLPSSQVNAELRQARALVFASLWYDVYGLVVSEAAACGVPALVSDVTAAVERIEDGQEGWHFRSGDAADLARVLRLTQDDEAVRAAGRRAYDRFWQNPPTRENHRTGLLGIYREVLADFSRACGKAPCSTRQG